MRSIFITGAASGMGKAAAARFHRAGWNVGMIDANESALSSFAEELSNAWFRAVDVRDADAVRRAVDDFLQTSGGQLHVVYNCAGVNRTGPFETLDAETQSFLIDVNIKGAIHVLLATFEALKATPNALVVNMSSASALYGTPDFSTYSATKFAIRALTEALDIEWAKHGIQVVDLMPPFVRGPMVESNPSPVMDRMGVNLAADDVIDVLVDIVESKNRSVHNPVSVQFKATMLAAKILPAAMTRQVMKFLSR